ncbi:MAG: DNA mismatch repair protein MutS, partial [Verrucomicrobiota bacterium]
MAKKKSGMTPMMEQYHSIRRSLPEDVLLMYRLGDFYEMFFEDAQEAASILNVALTKRNSIPMCGVPHHAAEGYIGKLIKANKRVAIAEQTSEPKPGKIVEREVTQIISAGTISDLNLLDAERPNYLAAIFKHGGKFGLAYVDMTTGDFRLTEFVSCEPLADELGRVCASELLVSDEQKEAFRQFPGVQIYDGYAFLPDQAEYTLREHFKVQSLDGFGCSELTAAVGAAGAVLHYLTHQMRRDAGHVRRLQRYQTESHVLIDGPSQANLELIQSRAGAKHTLLVALDKTKTPMGARKLRDWVLHPLRDLEKLQARQDMIGAFLKEAFVLCKVQDELKAIRDVERVLGRLSQGVGNPRDMQALAVSLDRLPDLRTHLEALGDQQLLKSLTPRLRDYSNLTDILSQALVDEPPVATK